MSRNFTRAFFAVCSFFISFYSNAQAGITPTTPVVQNFDGIGTTATATLPTGWKVDRPAGARTLGNYSTAGTATTAAGGTGLSSSAGNGLYNFGATASSADRAVGALSSGSGTTSANYYVQLQNTSTQNVGSLTLSYDVEKYRNGSNAAGFRIQLYYSTDGVNWTIAPGTDFTTAFAADADNNGYASAPGTTVSVTNKNLNVTIGSGGILYLAWNYSVTSGSTTTNSQALAIDNINIRANGVVSSNANLSNLTISAGSLAFDGSQNYTVTVPNNIPSVTVTPTKADANASIDVNGTPVVSGTPSNAISLAVGSNTINVNVKAENGTVKTYTVTVIRSAPAQPLLTTGSALSDFGSLCINTSSVKSFTLNGSDLDGSPIAIAASDGYSYSENANGPFQSSLSWAYSGSAFSNKIIYVKFQPANVQSYTANLIVSGGGVNNYAVAASGSGVNTATTVVTSAATNVSTTSANLNGTLSVQGCSPTTSYGFEYSTSNGFVSGTVVNSTNIAGNNFSFGLTGLNANTTYYYKAFAVNAAGTIYGAQQSFTTRANPVVMADQPYLTYKEDFSAVNSWGNNFTGSGADHFSTIFLNTTGTIPTPAKVTNSTAFSSGTSGGIQKGAGNIQLLATGGTDNTASTAFDVYFDFTGVNAGTLSFDWSVVFNSTGDRNGSLRVYATDNGTTFTELTSAAVLNFANNVTASGSVVSVALPSFFNNNPNARLRFYYYNGTGGASASPSGSRPKLAIDNLAVSAVSTTPCATPTAAPTNLQFQNIGETSLSLSFTAATPKASEYLVIASENSELSGNPSDGTVYETGDNFGDGFVVGKTATGSLDVTGLSSGTKYYFFVYAVNSVCVGGPKYLTTQILSADATTKQTLLPCAAPNDQPTDLILNAGTKNVNGNFTASGASGYLIVRSIGALSALPAAGTAYKTGDAIGNGTVVQQSASSSFAVSGLQPNTAYSFTVFAYNNTECLNGPAFNTAAPLTAEITTQALQPCVTPSVQPASLSFNVSNSTVAGTFNGIGGETSYLVVTSANSSLSVLPQNGTDYAIGDALGGGNVVSFNETTSFTAVNLAAGTKYYFFVFAANKNCTGGTKYLTVAPLTGNATTSNAPKYNYYFGNLHAHSDYSDGNQDNKGYTPTKDWEYATGAKGMDFLGISEHNHFSNADNPGTYLSLYHSGIEEAKAFNKTHPNFVALYGMEWGVISGGGHVVVYGDDMKELFGWESNVGGTTGPNYDVYVPKNVYTGSTGLFNNVNNFRSKNAFATLAHPNSDDYNNLSNIGYDAVADSAIVGTAVESGPSSSTNTTYSNPASPMSYLWYYQKMLAKGYHLGPVIDHDNHKTTFGKTTYARTAVLATELSSSALISAIRDMHFYATEDVDAKVDFTINTRIMGSSFADRNAPAISVNLSDATTNTSNAIIRIMYGIPGSGVTPVQVDSVIGSNLNFVHADLPINATGYYYADITNGSARIITSPIWYTRLCELTTTLNEKACGSFTWNGETYTASGSYTKQFRTTGGCDSIVTLNLIINQPTTGDTTAVVCDSFTWYGQTFTQSATATHVFTNSAGCDSIVTLHLTVNVSPKITLSADGNTTICPTSSVKLSALSDQASSYAWYQNGTLIPAVSGNEYTANTSGDYTVKAISSAGCSTFSNAVSVTVQDITAPVPDILSLPTITAECSVTVSVPTATDDCKGKIIATTNDPLIYHTQGEFVIHWKYDDGNGNITTQEQTVIVKDVTAPVPTVSQLPVISGECSATVTAPTALDNCKGTITGVTSDAITYSVQGSYIVHWKYDDGNGNITIQQQTVIVKDITAPVPTVSQLPVISGECSATVTAPTALDNCKGTIIGTTSDATTYTSQGAYIVHWKFDDGNGNITIQEQNVVVKDVTNPVITCAPSQFFCYSASNQYAIPVLSATDNCGIVSVSYSITGATNRTGSGNNASGYFNIGTSTVTWVVTDVNGNSSSCTTIVTINSQISVTIPDVYAVTPGGNVNTLYLGYGPASVSLNAVASNGVPAYSYIWSNGSTASVTSGTATYSVIATDAKGCTGSANKTIYVLDVRSGNKLDKVSVCHKGNSLSIGKEGVADHLQHGDKLGACSIASNTRESLSTSANNKVAIGTNRTMSVYPVPNQGRFTVLLNTGIAGLTEVRVTDMNGKVVASKKVMLTGRNDTVEFNLTDIAAGNYNVTVIGSNKQTVRISINR